MPNLEFGPFRLDSVKRTVTYAGGKLLGLTSREFDILELLVHNAGQLVARERFAETIWQGESVGETTLTTHLSSIRRKLSAAHPGAENYIRTVQGRGYRFCEAVMESPEGPTTKKHHVSIRRFSLLAALIAAAIPVWSSFKSGQIEITSFRKLTEDGRIKVGPLVFDGNNVYFRLVKTGEPQVETARVAVSSLKVEPLSGQEVASELMDYCKATRELLAMSSSSNSRVLSLFRPNGEQNEVLLKGSGLVSAGLSPDCRQLAYGGDHFVSIVHLTREGRVDSQLGQSRFWIPGTLNGPRWRPDGKLVRFCVDDDVHPAVLWELSTEGNRKPVPLQAAPEEVCGGAWTPDGRIFIAANRSQQPSGDLWALRNSVLHGMMARKVTPGALTWRDVVSDGLADRLYAIGQAYRFELSELNPHTGLIQPFLGGIAATEPSFSEDGKMVVYSKYPQWEIWLAQADGSQARKVSGPFTEAHMAHFSPNGQQIAFMAKTGASWRVMVADVRDLKARAAFPAGPDQGVPTWLSDHEIVFGDRLNHDDRDRNMSIHILDLAVRRISELPNSRGYWTPRVSPDQKRLIALSYDSTSLSEYDFKDQKWCPIGRARNFDNPAWISPETVYSYGVDSSGHVRVFRTDVAHSRTEVLTRLDATNIIPSPSITSTNEGHVVFLRRIEIDDIYELAYKIQ